MTEMYLIPQAGPGRFWVMPCPDPARLAGAMVDCRATGVDCVVSMLDADEARHLGVADEASVCADVGLDFHQLGIADFGLPAVEAFDQLVGDINGMIAGGKGVVVHCRAGVGRSGMVSSCVLIAQSQTAAAALETVTKARGISIPDTVEQSRFIADFEKRHLRSG